MPDLFLSITRPELESLNDGVPGFHIAKHTVTTGILAMTICAANGSLEHDIWFFPNWSAIINDILDGAT